jgi:hypothetical protein
MRPDPYSGSYDFSNPQSMNRYVYVLNEPVSNIDPIGLDLWSGDGYNGNDPNCSSGDVNCNGGGSGGGGGALSSQEEQDEITWLGSGSIPWFSVVGGDLMLGLPSQIVWVPNAEYDPHDQDSPSGGFSTQFGWVDLGSASIYLSMDSYLTNSAYQASGFFPLYTQVAFVGPIPVPVVSLGITVSATYIPKTDTLCIGPALTIASGGGKSLSATVYPSSNAEYTKDVVGGWGWSFGGQLSQLLGGSWSVNSSGQLFGYTVATDAGISGSYGYNFCSN